MSRRIRTTETLRKVVRDVSAPLAQVAPTTVEAALEAADQELEEKRAPVEPSASPLARDLAARAVAKPVGRGSKRRT
jgi:hypothetical protein